MVRVTENGEDFSISNPRWGLFVVDWSLPPRFNEYAEEELVEKSMSTLSKDDQVEQGPLSKD